MCNGKTDPMPLLRERVHKAQGDAADQVVWSPQSQAVQGLLA
jgi:hypothetical protein